MRIGVPREIKNREYRVGLTPASVRELARRGHEVIVQRDAGAAIGLSDAAYRQAGADVVETAEEVFAHGELIVKVKEPQPHECAWLREGQAIFTYLHLAPDRQQADLLRASGATAIAYETVTDAAGGLPLLVPMSEVAGRMSVQAGAAHLESSRGGSGVLLAGVPGVPPGRVAILGGGVVGYNAALTATGIGAQVTILERSPARLRWLDSHFAGRLQTVYATGEAIEAAIADADLIIGAVLVPGAATPRLVSREQLQTLRPGSVLVDVAIDQGGCFATSRPTTHDAPTYVVDGIVHYCVANMPGAVARTSTFALNHATLPFVLALADQGIREALLADPQLLAGLNVHRGKLACRPVAEALGLEHVAPGKLLRATG